MLRLFVIQEPWQRKRYTVGWTIRSSFPCKGKRFACCPQRADLLWGPPSLRLSECSRDRCLWREGDHSPASSIEGKTEWSYTSTPLHAFVACKETPLCFYLHVTPSSNFHQKPHTATYSLPTLKASLAAILWESSKHLCSLLQVPHITNWGFAGSLLKFCK
jgi:hypothetical protein